MHKLGFFKKTFVELCTILNNAKYTKVKTDKHSSSEFKVKEAVRQGDAIAPLLFNVVLEIAIKRSEA
jgi:hypothetical protein